MGHTGVHREYPPYSIELLVDDVPEGVLLGPTWAGTMKGISFNVLDGTASAARTKAAERWIEADENKSLFSTAQEWPRTDGRDLAQSPSTFLWFGS